MNREELARRAAVNLGMPVFPVLECLEALIADAEQVVASGHGVVWPNFGTFFARYKKPRVYKTPLPRKRAARAGETADAFRSMSLPKWAFVFSPSKRFCYAVAGPIAKKPPDKENAGAGGAMARRLAGVLGLSSVEVAEMLKELFTQIIEAVVRGDQVRIGNFGTFLNKRRAARRFNVQKAGGGRELLTIGPRVMPAFIRWAPSGREAPAGGI